MNIFWRSWARVTCVFILIAASLAMANEGVDQWDFKPTRDEFSPNANLDLRSLNEKAAGESGFVRVSNDGTGFVLGNGKSVRFWSINDDAVAKHALFPAPDLARNARFLAKRGVNMVRIFGNVTPTGDDLMVPDKSDIEKLWRAVAAMKKEGIYVTFCPYWAGPSRVKPDKMGTLSSGKNGNWGLLFFDAKLQQAYKSWMKQVLTTPNPYTGLPLCHDPALAILQIQNEDSLLFYTSQGIAGSAGQELRKQFSLFAAKKYGTFEKAMTAWENAAAPNDDIATGQLGLFLVWELTQHHGSAGHQKRCADQTQFFTETMYNFNKQIDEYLHKELDCKQLINAGNWRTADGVSLYDAERFSSTANQVMAVNRYYTGLHQGKCAGWAICNGDLFTDDSCLLHPRNLPVTLKQVAGFPMLVTESSWVPPLGYQSEGPFLISAYQSLSGVSSFYWFASAEETWNDWTLQSANGYMPSQGKWLCATPMLMGQFPAAAMMFRMNYVKQAMPIVQEERALDDLWQRKTPIIAEDAGYDPNRDSNISPQSNIQNGINPLAYLVGPVLVKYGGNPAHSKAVDLHPYIDEQKKLIKSATGELEWNYNQGICTLAAPKAQGVAGFLNKIGNFKLPDIELVCSNEYATVLAVSMDNQPLRSSRKILVQVGTVQRLTGWATKPAQVTQDNQSRAGEMIVSTGKKPWQIASAKLTVLVKNTTLKVAHVLDANGMRVKDIDLENVINGKKFTYPSDTLYVVLE